MEWLILFEKGGKVWKSCICGENGCGGNSVFCNVGIRVISVRGKWLWRVVEQC